MRAVTPLRQAARLSLFPNPAQNATTLVRAPVGAAIQLLDALGRLVAAATMDAVDTAELTLPAGLSGGVYLVRTGGQALRLLVPPR